MKKGDVQNPSSAWGEKKREPVSAQVLPKREEVAFRGGGRRHPFCRDRACRKKGRGGNTPCATERERVKGFLNDRGKGESSFRIKRGGGIEKRDLSAREVKEEGNQTERLGVQESAHHFLS